MIYQIKLCSIIFLVRYFSEVVKNIGHCCFGVDKTLEALKAGALETMIVWENFDMRHYFPRQSQKQEFETKKIYGEQENADLDNEWEYVEKITLLEWLVRNCKNFGKRY